MLPKIAIIKGEEKLPYSKKILGLYPLERNLRLLWQLGFKKVLLDLNESELEHYEKNIQNKINKLKNFQVSCLSNEKKEKSDVLVINSVAFLQIHYFSDMKNNFKKSGNTIQPILNNEIFLLKNESDIKKAEDLAIQHIRLSAGSVIARNLNKKISLPISRKLANTGIHPNFITTFNFLLGITSGILLFYDTWFFIAISGLLLQIVSILDGCDGEIAKMTMKFSKFGSIFDTFSDYSTILLYAFGLAYLIFIKTASFSLKVIAIVGGLSGLFMSIIAVIVFLLKYSETFSFVAYYNEFWAKLPKKDIVVIFMDKTKILIKKEFYSLLICLFGLTGLTFYLGYFYALTMFVTGILIVTTNIRYSRYMKSSKTGFEMVYIPRR